MEKDQFWILMTRYLSGEATIEEVDELNKQIESNNSYRQYFEKATSAWDAKVADEKDSLKLNSAKQKLLQKLDLSENSNLSKVDQKITKYSWLKTAASISFLILFSLIGSRYFSFSEGELNVIEAEAGSRQEFILPDGTHVWLNSSSKLSYNPHTYNAERRYVELDGEGFFEVHRNELKPFIVSSGTMKTVVLGTSFNVKSYEGDTFKSVSVLEGKVAVFGSDDEENKVLLTASEEAVYSPVQGDFLKAENVDIEQRSAWKNGEIVFDNIPLGEALKILSRKFDITFRVKNNKLNNCLIKANFQSESLQTIMNMIGATIGFEHQYVQNEIIIDGLGCEKQENEKG